MDCVLKIQVQVNVSQIWKEYIPYMPKKKKNQTEIFYQLQTSNSQLVVYNTCSEYKFTDLQHHVNNSNTVHAVVMLLWQLAFILE